MTSVRLFLLLVVARFSLTVRSAVSDCYPQWVFSPWVDTLDEQTVLGKHPKLTYYELMTHLK